MSNINEGTYIVEDCRCNMPWLPNGLVSIRDVAACVLRDKHEVVIFCIVYPAPFFLNTVEIDFAKEGELH